MIEVSIPPQRVYCVPLDTDNLVLIVPAIPEDMQYDMTDYQDFLSDFIEIQCHETLEGATESGLVVVKHRHLQLRFEALTPYIRAMIDAGQVTLLPYHPARGLPTRPVHGAIVQIRDMAAA